jgi:hypothetical protein
MRHCNATKQSTLTFLLLDCFAEPVIGLAEGETRWRVYDASSGTAQYTKLQFNTRLLSGLSSENVGTSISNRSPLSLTIW